MASRWQRRRTCTDRERAPWRALLLAGSVAACDANPPADRADGASTRDTEAPLPPDAVAPADTRTPEDAPATPEAPALDAAVTPDATTADGGTPDVEPDRAPPTPVTPPSFGAGFTDLTASVPAPFTLGPVMDGDPEFTAGLAVLTAGMTPSELFLSQRRQDFGAITTERYRYDAINRRMVTVGRLAPGMDAQPAPVALLDLDGDGALDALSSRVSEELHWGTTEGALEPPRALFPPTGTYIQPWSDIALDDIDDDGWLDLVVGAAGCCSTCRSVRLFIRTGPRTFEERPELVEDPQRGSVEAIFSGRLGAERVVVVLVSSCGSMDSPVFYRRVERPGGVLRWVAWDPLPTEGYLQRRAPPAEAGRGLSLYAPMGCSTDDLDGDGHDDLAITLHGYTALYSGRGRVPMVDVSDLYGSPEALNDLGRPMIPWDVASVDLDRDGRPDRVVTHGDDHAASSDPRSLVGPQRVVANWNAGAGRYLDVTRALHLDALAQWRALTVTDLDQDGDADLLVGGYGVLPRVYRNDITGGHGLSLRLRGSLSNAWGVGAEVRLAASGARPAQRVVMGARGGALVTEEPLVFLGLGADTTARELEVRWPSGYLQTLRDVPSGRLVTVQEPELVTVTPATRHVPADGRSTVTVRVTPRAPDGSPREAPVDGVAHTGVGALPLRARREGSATVLELTAPGTPGSATLELRVGGVPWRVRPRVWFDRR
ncbi:MAG: VCBS repeat-containing protein [Deltaproteobacteria bacterium]|nr:VCBS repeat-containing protein [Deltaproteobacteria bacterium]